MTSPQMMPPPLPGYPQAAPPPAAVQMAPPAPQVAYPMPVQTQPQGYPGPAVAPTAPQQYAPPAPAAQPGPYPVYAQPQHAPPAQYAQPQQYGAPAPAGDIGAAIAAATGGDKAPRFVAGQYTLEVVETLVTRHPVEGYLTFKSRFKVITSTSPAFPPGAEGAYIEGLSYGAGRIQDFLVAASGYPTKPAFDQSMAGAGHDPVLMLQMLGNAAATPTAQTPGNPYPANPLAGRRVHTVVIEYDKAAGPKSRKPAGTMVHVINHTWSPAT